MRFGGREVEMWMLMQMHVSLGMGVSAGLRVRIVYQPFGAGSRVWSDWRGGWFGDEERVVCLLDGRNFLPWMDGLIRSMA